MFCCCCCCYFISLQCRQPFFTFSAHSVFIFFLAPLFCRTRYCCCFYFPFSRAICAFVLLLFFARASPFNSYYFCIFFCFCSRAFFFSSYMSVPLVLIVVVGARNPHLIALQRLHVAENTTCTPTHTHTQREKRVKIQKQQ